MEASGAVLDADRLAGALSAAARKRAAGSPESRAKVLARLKAALEEGRGEVRRRFDAGASGSATARACAALIDGLLACVHHHAVETVYPATNPSSAEHLAIIGVGGYGRGEMAPYSDVDLLFLLPYKQTPWGEQVVEYVLYLLWDMGLKVGHATRSVEICLQLAKRDQSIRTALLEARWIAGDQVLYEDLRRRFVREVAAGTGAEFVAVKLAERDARHARFGQSRYLVEPNVKEGKGGLRDLHTLFWIAKYLYRTDRVADLVERGVLSARERARFAKAESFLWTVRCQLHYLAGRAEERLTFDVQSEIGRRLHYRDHTGATGVERFMKHYYLVAKDVGALTRIFCAALEERHKRKPVFRLPRLALKRRRIEGFVVERGRLNVTGEDAFAADPVAMLRLFHLADRHKLDVHPDALRQITRHLKKLGPRVRNDAEANRLFLEVLTSRKDPETALRRMNEAGVFGRFVPDFGRVVAQTQHDMYHVYTVDEHTIRAVGQLAEIEKGTLVQDLPLASELVHQIQSRRVLYLGVLMHDIAKGRGGSHSEIGAGLARRLGRRLGLSPEETETVAWLVRHHLAMSHFAFKRDLQDPKTVADFAAMVQSPERLRLLLVLTAADIRAVGPGRWNGWKGQLLSDLYTLAEEALTGAHQGQRHAQRVAAARAGLRDRLGVQWTNAEFERHAARTSETYWLWADLATLERHALMMRTADRDAVPLTVTTRTDRGRAATEITVYTADRPGLFARLAGAVALSGANVVNAKIFTTSDGMALDTLWIQDAGRGAFGRPEKHARLRATIERVLLDGGDLADGLAKRSGIPSRTRVFKVEPRVLFDNQASDRTTVIEVNGRDRRGLLYDVTVALAERGLSIAGASVATFGARAVDVFYVTDRDGGKVTHARRVASVRNHLLAALSGQKPTPARPAKAAAKTAAPVKRAAGSGTGGRAGTRTGKSRAPDSAARAKGARGS